MSQNVNLTVTLGLIIKIVGGDSNDTVMADFVEYGFVGVLSKSYNQDHLVQVVSGILKK